MNMASKLIALLLCTMLAAGCGNRDRTPPPASPEEALSRREEISSLLPAAEGREQTSLLEEHSRESSQREASIPQEPFSIAVPEPSEHSASPRLAQEAIPPIGVEPPPSEPMIPTMPRDQLSAPTISPPAGSPAYPPASSPPPISVEPITGSEQSLPERAPGAFEDWGTHFRETEPIPPSQAGITDSGNAFSPAMGEEQTGGIDPVLFEEELLRLINAEREANGREPLGLEESMRWAARMRAPEVLQSLSHSRPDGTPYYTAFEEAGFVYAGKWHGENVSNMQFSEGSYDALSAASYMFDQLRSSAGHNNNMLSENFVQIGIGVFVQMDANGMVRIGSAQMFAGL